MLKEREGLKALLAILVVGCECGWYISDYNLISDHYKVTTGLGSWCRSEAAGCELSLRMRGSEEDTDISQWEPSITDH